MANLLVGIGGELLDVSEGVNLDDLPARDAVSPLLEQEHIKIVASV